MHTPLATSRLLIVRLAAGALLAACSSTALTPVQAGGHSVSADGLEQDATITTPARSGANVTIRSVLHNRGSQPLTVESRMCGLNYGGTLQLSWPPELGKCAGYSMRGPLAVGDSIVTSDVMRIDSPPGTYTLQVTHALEPRLVSEFQVVVQ
jgi:hypothetical protein